MRPPAFAARLRQAGASLAGADKKAAGSFETAQPFFGSIRADHWSELPESKPVPPTGVPPKPSASQPLPAPAKTLASAVSRGDEAAVAALLAEGAKVNELELGSAPLHLAAERGFDGIARRLLDAGAEVDAPNAAGASALACAAANGHRGVALLLLERGASANAIRSDRPSPLDYSIALGQGDLCQLLLEHRADANRPGKEGDRPLYAAVARGRVDLVEILLTAGADPDLPNDRNQASPREETGDRNIYDSVTDPVMFALLRRHSKKAQAPRKDRGFAATLRRAAYTGDPALAKALLSQPGFRLDAEETENDAPGQVTTLAAGERKSWENPLGYTFFSRAVMYDQRALARFLLEQGARPRGRTNSGEPLLLAVIERGWDDVAGEMIEHGVELDVQGYFDRATAIATLAEQGDVRWVKRLLEAGANASLAGDGGITPLLRAATAGQLPAVELLLAHGAAIEQAAANGLTPLAAAAANGHNKVCRLLLEREARVNTRDKTGQTPLHHAASAGRSDLVELLLAAGAEPQARDGEKKTALDLAEEAADVESAALLHRAQR